MKAIVVLCALLGVSFAHAETTAHKPAHKKEHVVKKEVKKDGQGVIKEKKTTTETTQDEQGTMGTEEHSDEAHGE
jgi:hypothetical protein